MPHRGTEQGRMRRSRGQSTTARIVVLAISAAAAGGAAYLVSGKDLRPAAAEVVVQQAATMEVLVAKSDIGLGQKVGGKLQWQAWPQTATGASLIRRSERPNAMTQLGDSIARTPFIEGEPVREAKLISLNGSGFMAAILPGGMRAVSTPISPETGAGGFILPNDRVDVILSKRDKNTEAVKSQVILNSVRVLAIDQAPKEKDGQTSVIGRTATLKATQEQAEMLARANMRGTLSLALRSLADAELPAKVTRKTIAVYRGVGAQTFYNCAPSCEGE
jgi:pilus assembly protein CpaB